MTTARPGSSSVGAVQNAGVKDCRSLLSQGHLTIAEVELALLLRHAEILHLNKLDVELVRVGGIFCGSSDSPPRRASACGWCV